MHACVLYRRSDRLEELKFGVENYIKPLEVIGYFWARYSHPQAPGSGGLKMGVENAPGVINLMPYYSVK